MTRKIKSSLALALALGAIVPASASARPQPDNGPYWPGAVRHSAQTVSTTQRPPQAIVQVNTSDGFDWGDAGIGAAGAVGLTALAMGGAVMVRRHGRQAHGPTGATS
jgi:hypothetical protein